ncbi:hypothetical protein RF11_15390 [Thelohanellus kitauei]|uniref:Uncharacterized protein n=1 Tax=Thelohanellus kitauei TaxID=669202 RepID=A0A0C2ITY7_THEKT|nr:hypothetical protein RF11_15390 [Thelohanellus kitauei]
MKILRMVLNRLKADPSRDLNSYPAVYMGPVKTHFRSERAIVTVVFITLLAIVLFIALMIKCWENHWCCFGPRRPSLVTENIQISLINEHGDVGPSQETNDACKSPP